MIREQRNFNPIEEEEYIVDAVIDFLFTIVGEVVIEREEEFKLSEVIIEKLPDGKEIIKVGEYYRIVSKENPQVFKVHSEKI